MKISIVIPVYNAENFLEKCLDSIINQSYKNIEILCVNDGSTDNSLDILKRYSSKDKRFILINQTNQGGVCARMNALQKCTGKYVMFIDSDDWIEKESLKKLVDYIQKYSEVDIVKFRYVMKPNGIIQEKYFDVEKIFYKDDMLEIYKELFVSSKYNNLANQIVKKELLNYVKYDELKFINQGDDKYINVDLFLNAKSILFVNDILYNYFYNSNSISHNTNIAKYIEKFNSLGLLYCKINKIVEKKFKNDGNFIKKVKVSQLNNYANYIKNFLVIKSSKKDDLNSIQLAIEKTGMYNYLDDVLTEKLNLGFLNNIFARNVLNRSIVKCYRFKILFTIKRYIRG